MAQDSEGVRKVVLRRIREWTRICVGTNRWFLLSDEARDILEHRYINGGDEAVRLEGAQGREGAGTGKFEDVQISKIIGILGAGTSEED